MRRAAALLAGLLLCAAAAVASAQAPAPAPRSGASEIELGGSRENLSNNQPDWRSLSLDAAHHFAPRQTLYGGLRATERFGLDDTELWAGYYHPLSADWTSLVEASASDTHRVLAKYSVFGQLSRRLPYGWVLGAGVRHSEYTGSGVNLLVLDAERYWGSFRAGYTLYAGRPEGAQTGVSHRLALNYYYGERSFVGLSVADGREVENVGPPVGVVVTDVFNVTLSGRHWITPAWALAWDLVSHEQGRLYRREGLRVGLRHRF